MGREEAAYDDEFDAAVNDDEYELDIGNKENLIGKETSPLAKRRMIEALLEERSLRRQLRDPYDFDED